MHLDTRFVGLQLREHHLSISDRQCVNFAAGIGDENPFFYDDERPAGLIAHPMLATALTWQVAGKIWEFIPSGDFPTQLILTQVHYSEHLQFYTPLHPGMRLTLQGNIAAILPHRSGTQVIVRFDAMNTEGRPVFTEYIGGLLRGITCNGLGEGAENLPILPPQPETSAAPQWVETLTLSKLAPYLYDACADVHFPIHSSPRFAHQVGLPGVIVQGTQTLARAVSVILQRQAENDPRCLAELACRFAGMVRPGETLQLRLWAALSGEMGAQLFFDVIKADGTPAVRAGYCRLLPAIQV